MDNKNKIWLEILNISSGLIIWSLIIFLILTNTKRAYVSASNIVDDLLDNTDKDYKEYILVLEEETSYDDVLKKLEEEEIIYNYYVVKFNNFIQGVRRNFIQEGTYTLNNNMALNDINGVLSTKSTKIADNEKVVTIVEGITIRELGILLDSQELVDKDDFVLVANTYDFKSDFSWLGEIEENYLEGYLYPDTYNFYVDTTSEAIIYKLLRRFEEIYMPYVEEAENRGMTLNEVITMASIIQKEVTINEERPKVSEVIQNRIKSNITLDMTSTIVYILNKREENLTSSDYDVTSPYNTYKNLGLPPKPICSPSIASIDAVFNYSDMGYLYFIDVEDGGHLFTSDYSEIE